MKVHVYSLEGKPLEELKLPEVFKEEFRPDLIRRAVISAQTSRFQPRGSDELAGKRTSAHTWGKGHGVARVKKVKGSRYPAAGMGAFSPQTVGGRRAHPPKVEKILKEQINRKERRKAIRSAIAATRERKVVERRGHRLGEVPELPLVVADDIEHVKETSIMLETLHHFGLKEELERVKGRKIRAGKGKMRSRRYRRKVGPLIVVEKANEIRRGAGNIPGVDVIEINKLGAEPLAPGGVPGRLTIWSRGAIQKLTEGK
jgi:large subunit ribosomal protein L4e